MELFTNFADWLQLFWLHILASLGTLFGVVAVWYRFKKTQLFFKIYYNLGDVLFQINVTEQLEMSDVLTLQRIKEKTFANRVAFINFNRNGQTEIKVLQEIRSDGLTNLQQLNSRTAHQYRDLIDSLHIEKGLMKFDKTTQKHKDFYNLINQGFEANEFILIPLYQSDIRHHVVVIMLCFDGFKTFKNDIYDYVKSFATKNAKTSYLNSKI